ncbi:MAG: class I SAM-dependent methyltransferase [Myxococcota bacterium]
MMNTDRYAKMWNVPFRIGAYDFFIPINFDQSLKATFDALAPAPDEHILDVGCGSGRVLLHAGPWLQSGGRLTGIDIAEGGLTFAKNRATTLGVESQVSLVQGDMRSLSDALDGTFDGAMVHFAVYTLSSEADRARTLQQIARVLRPGGRLAITVPSEGYRARPLIRDARVRESRRSDISTPVRLFRKWVLYSFMEVATRRHVESKLDVDVFHRYTREELEAHLKEAGFTDIYIEQLHGVESYRATAVKDTRLPD